MKSTNRSLSPARFDRHTGPARARHGARQWSERLFQKYRKAWNGLSILVFAEDSASPPQSYRINYLIILFFGAIIVILPLAALGGVFSRISSQTYSGRMSARIALLGSASAVNEEKQALFEKVRARSIAYQKLSNRFQNAGLVFEAVDEQSAAPLQGYNSMEREQKRVRDMRRSFFAYLEDNRQNVSFLEHRLAIYDITPRGIPLRRKHLMWMGGYGNRTNPVTGSGTEFHQGVDLIASAGRPVIATAPGTVIEVADEATGGYGLFVRIHHGMGYTTLYAHNTENLVEEGDKVKRGQVIAKVGDTGRATGAHLHYEVQIGPQFQQGPPWKRRRAEDPRTFM